MKHNICNLIIKHSFQLFQNFFTPTRITNVVMVVGSFQHHYKTIKHTLASHWIHEAQIIYKNLQFSLQFFKAQHSYSTITQVVS